MCRCRRSWCLFQHAKFIEFVVMKDWIERTPMALVLPVACKLSRLIFVFASLQMFSSCWYYLNIWLGYGTSIYTSQNGFYSVSWTDVRLAIRLGLINRMFGFADAIKKITRLPVSVCFCIYVAPFINSFQTHIQWLEWLLKCFCMDFIHGFPIVLNVH